MTYRKPEIVVLGEASQTIRDNTCCYSFDCKGDPFTDGTSASGCSGSPLSGFNPSAAYDLDE